MSVWSASSGLGCLHDGREGVTEVDERATSHRLGEEHLIAFPCGDVSKPDNLFRDREELCRDSGDSRGCGIAPVLGEDELPVGLGIQSLALQNGTRDEGTRLQSILFHRPRIASTTEENRIGHLESFENLYGNFPHCHCRSDPFDILHIRIA